MRVQVNVSDDLVERIDFYAKKMGTSRSALCSLFIGMGMIGLEKSNTILDNIGDKMESDFFTNFQPTAEKKIKSR